MTDPDKTRYTLIQKALNLSDDRAWNELHDQYINFIYYLLRQMNVNENDLDDIAQRVMITMMEKLKAYDSSRGKFRTWLMMVIKSTTIMHFRKVKSLQDKHDVYEAHLNEEAAETDMDVLIEKQWINYITSVAKQRLKRHFRGDAIKVFELGLEGNSVEEIAEKTGLGKSSIYTLRQRVKKALMRETKSLMLDLEGE